LKAGPWRLWPIGSPTRRDALCPCETARQCPEMVKDDFADITASHWRRQLLDKRGKRRFRIELGTAPQYLAAHCVPVSATESRQHLRSAASHQLVVPSQSTEFLRTSGLLCCWSDDVELSTETIA